MNYYLKEFTHIFGLDSSRDLFGSRWANIWFKIHSLFARTPPAEPGFLSLGRTSSLKSDTCLPIPAFRDLFDSRWANIRFRTGSLFAHQPPARPGFPIASQTSIKKQTAQQAVCRPFPLFLVQSLSQSLREFLYVVIARFLPPKRAIVSEKLRFTLADRKAPYRFPFRQQSSHTLNR